MKKSRTAKFDAARLMPAIAHGENDATFDIETSSVVDWLCAQPSIRQYVFDKARQSRCKGGLNVIEYDSETKKWHGIDWNER